MCVVLRGVGRPMQAHYLVAITAPQHHLVTVTISLVKCGESMTVFSAQLVPLAPILCESMPAIFEPFACSKKMARFSTTDKSIRGPFAIDFAGSELKRPQQEFFVTYEVYCHELTVRTAHIDESHAFLHGPSYLMGVVGESLSAPTIEFRFPPLWSKVATALEDVSQDRAHFIYRAAPNYDQLIDSPVEIGCHESDGFMVRGKPHHLNFYGVQYPHGQELKQDMQKIVETVGNVWGELPFQEYVFITHFAPDCYGGLEHHDSCALHFDGARLNQRKQYLSWLELVAHEYFHVWNGKRIRPRELSSFDYRGENYTRMHWLTEGLTSFMDRLLVLRSGLMSVEEYLERLVREFNDYSQIPGRKFHSLEESSFNAWIKLYRPDENSKNSSVSYYLKGGLVFLALQCMLSQKHRDITDLLGLLWQRYLRDPQLGLEACEVYQMIESLAGPKVRERFEGYITHHPGDRLYFSSW